MHKTQGWILAALALLTGTVALLHYTTPIHHHHLHAIYQRLYYLPILFAAYFWGLRGALGFAALAALSYAPHIALQWNGMGMEHDRFTQWVEIVMFFVLGSLAGILFGIRQTQRVQILRQQEELRRNERLAIMGRLAGGLAHEIRNPVASLMGAADIVGRSIPQDSPAGEFSGILHRELHRLKGIVDQFLSFAKPAAPRPTPCDPEEVVRSAVALARSQLQKFAVEVDVLPHGTGMLRMDGNQVEQILLNLLLNAAEASPQGGRIAVSIHREPPWLLFLVQDEGPGIEESRREEVFEPFATTKTDGTGLGLATSRQLAEAMGGSLRVLATDSGALLELRLPMVHPG